MPFPQLGIRELKWLRRTNDEYQTDSLHILYYFAAKNRVSISVVVLSMIALGAALPNQIFEAAAMYKDALNALGYVRHGPAQE